MVFLFLLMFDAVSAGFSYFIVTRYLCTVNGLANLSPVLFGKNCNIRHYL